MVNEKSIIVPKLVLIESPFKGADYNETRDNILYARACVHDSISRGEAPYASHLFFTQAGILNDKIEEERMMGIDAGLAWGANAELSAFYIDRGISGGMEYGMASAKKIGRPIEERSLGNKSDVEEIIRKMGDAIPFINTGILF